MGLNPAYFRASSEESVLESSDRLPHFVHQVPGEPSRPTRVFLVHDPAVQVQTLPDVFQHKTVRSRDESTDNGRDREENEPEEQSTHLLLHH